MNGTRRLWGLLTASLWFVPTLVVLASIAAAVLLIDTSGLVGDEMVRQWPRVFGAGSDGSREMLSAIATSMITVAGVVFSITIVALSMAATQYSPRVLRNFMRDRPTQYVLGVFVGCFAYCVVVLRTIRQDEDLGNFVPTLAVLGAMAYAFAAIALLIFFIHHVAQSIQAPFIVARIAQEVDAAIEDMYPEKIGRGERDSAPPAATALPATWTPLLAEADGYVIGVAGEELLAFAREQRRVVRLRIEIGEFVPRGSIVLELSGQDSIGDDDARRLRSCVAVGRQRTTDQDPTFGIQQLVDVAVKALSPGINDPSTAALCVDHLAAVLARLAGRRLPDPFRMADGQLRVIAPSPDFRAIVIRAFGDIVHHARQEPLLLQRIVDRLGSIGDATDDPQRRRAVAWVAAAIRRAAADPARSSQLTLARRQAAALATRMRRADGPAREDS